MLRATTYNLQLTTYNLQAASYFSGAPKGIAALYARRGVPLPSFIRGGGDAELAEEAEDLRQQVHTTYNLQLTTYILLVLHP